MVIYLPVKFAFDWTKFSRTNRKKQTELHQFRKEPGYDSDLSPCQV